MHKIQLMLMMSKDDLYDENAVHVKNRPCQTISASWSSWSLCNYSREMSKSLLNSEFVHVQREKVKLKAAAARESTQWSQDGQASPSAFTLATTTEDRAADSNQVRSDNEDNDYFNHTNDYDNGLCPELNLCAPH